MIYELLSEGKENKITTRELMSITGLSEREIVARVRKERGDKKMIMSTKVDGGGYFRPSTLEEMQIYYRQMRKSALSTLAIITAVRHEIKSRGGQV